MQIVCSRCGKRSTSQFVEHDSLDGAEGKVVFPVETFEGIKVEYLDYNNVLTISCDCGEVVHIKPSI